MKRILNTKTGLLALTAILACLIMVTGAALAEPTVTWTGINYPWGMSADGSVVADGTSATVWVDYEAGKALRIPDTLVDTIAEIEQNPDLRKRGKS